MKKEKFTKIEIDMMRYLIYQAWINFKHLQTKKLNLHETEITIDQGMSGLEIILCGIFNFESPRDMQISHDEVLELSKNIHELIRKCGKAKDQNTGNSIN